MSIRVLHFQLKDVNNKIIPLHNIDWSCSLVFAINNNKDT